MKRRIWMKIQDYIIYSIYIRLWNILKYNIMGQYGSHILFLLHTWINSTTTLCVRDWRDEVKIPHRKMSHLNTCLCSETGMFILWKWMLCWYKYYIRVPACIFSPVYCFWYIQLRKCFHFSIKIMHVKYQILDEAIWCH